jgi:Restriction Enzyme Adenine Methylase Associated
MLAAGATLKFKRPRIGDTHRAVVTDAGGIKLDDGQEFRSPSRAAAVAADVPAMDGWHAWVVDSSRRSLDSLRQEFLDQVAARSAGDASPALLRPDEFLKDARSRADANDPVEISVRDLLTLWTAKSRGHRISQRIEAGPAPGQPAQDDHRALVGRPHLPLPVRLTRLGAEPLSENRQGNAPRLGPQLQRGGKKRRRHARLGPTRTDKTMPRRFTDLARHRTLVRAS